MNADKSPHTSSAATAHSSPSPGWVVVGVDGSHDGERAVAYGVEEARERGCRLRLVHVPHESVPMAPMLPLFSSETLHEIGSKILDQAVRQAHDLAGDDLEIDQVLEHGPRVKVLLQTAADAACIVLGTRTPGLTRVLTGATTHGVAARADCPVFCVPHSWSPGHRQDIVSVGVDGSDPSLQALDAAYDEADRRRLRLRVLYAWRPSDMYDAAVGGRTLATQWEQTTRRAVAELCAGRSELHPDVDVTFDLAYDWPTTALLRAAEDSDLIVLGRHGHGGALGHSLGSTVRAMLRAGTCPIEVVPTEPVARHRGDTP